MSVVNESIAACVTKPFDFSGFLVDFDLKICILNHCMACRFLEAVYGLVPGFNPYRPLQWKGESGQSIPPETKFPIMDILADKKSCADPCAYIGNLVSIYLKRFTSHHPSPWLSRILGEWRLKW